jgi:hypothetical protein
VLRNIDVGLHIGDYFKAYYTKPAKILYLESLTIFHPTYVKEIILHISCTALQSNNQLTVCQAVFKYSLKTRVWPGKLMLTSNSDPVRFLKN